jgi:hypothetical protein
MRTDRHRLKLRGGLSQLLVMNTPEVSWKHNGKRSPGRHSKRWEHDTEKIFDKRVLKILSGLNWMQRLFVVNTQLTKVVETS